MRTSKRAPSISGPSLVPGEAATSYERASDEHGRPGISSTTNRLNIGDKVCPIPVIATMNAVVDSLSPYGIPISICRRHRNRSGRLFKRRSTPLIEAEHDAMILYGSMDRQALDAANDNSDDRRFVGSQG
jgi:hypothetical protein